MADLLSKKDLFRIGMIERKEHAIADTAAKRAPKHSIGTTQWQQQHAERLRKRWDPAFCGYYSCLSCRTFLL